MLQNNPWIAQDDAMNRALDLAYKRGIGLVSMKQVAGNMNLEEIGMNLPELAGTGLTPYQALLHAIWSDERFASVCVSMRNTDQIRENAAAARVFRPMTRAAINRLRDACIAAGPTMCASCDGRCSRAAGTTAELGNLTRFLTYHDHHGHRAEARRLYAGLDDAARDWRGADLEAARRACPNRLDFAGLLPTGRRGPRLTAPSARRSIDMWKSLRGRRPLERLPIAASGLLVLLLDGNLPLRRFLRGRGQIRMAKSRTRGVDLLAGAVESLFRTPLRGFRNRL